MEPELTIRQLQMAQFAIDRLQTHLLEELGYDSLNLWGIPRVRGKPNPSRTQLDTARQELEDLYQTLQKGIDQLCHEAWKG